MIPGQRPPADAVVIYGARRYRLRGGRVVASGPDGRTEIVARDRLPLPVARAFGLGPPGRRLAA